MVKKVEFRNNSGASFKTKDAFTEKAAEALWERLANGQDISYQRVGVFGVVIFNQEVWAGEVYRDSFSAHVSKGFRKASIRDRESQLRRVEGALAQSHPYYHEITRAIQLERTAAKL